MIEVVPQGGLCNRLRVVASARLLAQRAGVPLKVHWLRTPDFNAAFASLFETDRLDFKVVEHGGPRWAQVVSLRLVETALRARGLSVLGQRTTAPDRFDLTRALALAQHSRLWLRTSSRLLTQAGMYAPFVPIARLRQEVARYSGDVTRTVGVHIRRTDNAQAIARSPFSGFELAMAQELEIRPETVFFVATDDLNTLEALRLRFGELVLSYPKRSLLRSNPKALEDAVIDLFCLAQSRKVLGSYWSSFSETAWELRDLEHEVIGAD